MLSCEWGGVAVFSGHHVTSHKQQCTILLLPVASLVASRCDIVTRFGGTRDAHTEIQIKARALRFFMFSSSKLFNQYFCVHAYR
ncbi:hypothetical protein RRG08_045018 [Elysia crispata]|uniref:Uncharacterized protein n=1 Tax=Elysia crispata TaxID=231223 RepID=A0AAE0Y4Q8_9GAST|nr:hypothetical protein RRG08_045018 [Elysia crispata]